MKKLASILALYLGVSLFSPRAGAQSLGIKTIQEDLWSRYYTGAQLTVDNSGVSTQLGFIVPVDSNKTSIDLLFNQEDKSGVLALFSEKYGIKADLGRNAVLELMLKPDNVGVAVRGPPYPSVRLFTGDKYGRTYVYSQAELDKEDGFSLQGAASHTLPMNGYYFTPFAVIGLRNKNIEGMIGFYLSNKPNYIIFALYNEGRKAKTLLKYAIHF